MMRKYIIFSNFVSIIKKSCDCRTPSNWLQS